MAINDNSDFPQALQDKYDSGRLDDFLERGNRDMHTQVGKHVRHDEFAKDDKQEVFDVPVADVLSFERVEFDGEALDESDFTEDTDKGEITLSSSKKDEVSRGDVVRIYFRPTAFKDLELENAIKHAWRNRFRSTGNDSDRVAIDNTKEAIKELINEINGLNSSTAAAENSTRGRPTGR